MCTAKPCLVFLNSVFLHFWIILFSISILIETFFNSNYQPCRCHLGSPAALIVAFGALLSAMSLLALLSVYWQNNCLLTVYICSLILLIIIELSLVIAGFLIRSYALRIIKDSLLSSEAKYTSNNFASSTWSSVQRELKCCGVNHYMGWSGYFGNSLPDTCCVRYEIDCGWGTALKTGNHHHRDCATAIYKWVEFNGNSLSIVFMLIITFQLISLLLAILTRFSPDED